MLKQLLIMVIGIGLILGLGFIAFNVIEEDYDITKEYDQYQYCRSFCNSIDNCDIVNSEINNGELVCKYYQNGVYKTHNISIDEFR